MKFEFQFFGNNKTHTLQIQLSGEYYFTYIQKYYTKIQIKMEIRIRKYKKVFFAFILKKIEI